MKVVCPKCRRVLAGSDLNVSTDVARCSGCDEVYTLSSLVQASESGAFDPNDAPRGAWLRTEFNGFTVGATTRNPIAFFLVPFMCVWSGFSLGGIYGSQFVQGRFNLLSSLFGIPFVLGTIFFGAMALMAVCGKVVVEVSDAGGVVFTGIGLVGWRKSFNPTELTAVRVERYASGRNQQLMTIVLDGPHKLRFGSGLTEARRDFIANFLRQELTVGKKGRGVNW
jgi:hypothetical protein